METIITKCILNWWTLPSTSSILSWKNNSLCLKWSFLVIDFSNEIGILPQFKNETLITFATIVQSCSISRILNLWAHWHTTSWWWVELEVRQTVAGYLLSCSDQLRVLSTWAVLTLIIPFKTNLTYTLLWILFIGSNCKHNIPAIKNTSSILPNKPPLTEAPNLWIDKSGDRVRYVGTVQHTGGGGGHKYLALGTCTQLLLTRLATHRCEVVEWWFRAFAHCRLLQLFRWWRLFIWALVGQLQDFYTLPYIAQNLCAVVEWFWIEKKEILFVNWWQCLRTWP